MTLSYSCVRVPMTFDRENRLVHVTPIADLGGCSGRKPEAKAKRESEYPKLVNALTKILARHPDERILVHTVSYDLADYVTQRLLVTLGPSHKRLLTYKSASERDRIIERYRKTNAGVLIASSLERGADFKHDDCRVVVVCKVPFPNLGDRQIAARLHTPGGQGWYSAMTARSLVQMTGRGVRSADDWSTSYILDKQFIRFKQQNRAWLPQWWVEALDMSAQYVSEFSKP